MLSIGLTEILLIGVVVLLVVGPERLPRLMRTAGRTYGQLRRAADDLRRAFVLEADRQDADERMDALRERRRRATEARRRAKDKAEPSAAAPVAQEKPELNQAAVDVTEDAVDVTEDAVDETEDAVDETEDAVEVPPVSAISESS